MSCPPQVESLALTFLNHKQLRSAAWFFARCLAVQPSNANVWYGIGDALTALGFRHNVNKWTETGIACHKRADKESPGGHPISAGFLTMLKEQSDKGKELVESVECWDKSVELLLEAIPFTEEVLISEFREIDNENDRLAILMFGGESKFSEILPLFEFALFSQADTNPKLVVLETLHLFKENPKVEAFFRRMAEEEMQNTLEPYFSTALDRINLPWTHEIPRGK